MTDTAGQETAPTHPRPAFVPASATQIPVHPPLTHITIGAYTAAVVFDLLSIARITGPATGHALYQSGTYALLVGTAAFILAMVSGLVERASRTVAGSRERRAANRHGILMGLVGLLAVVDIVIRWHGLAGSARTPAAVFAVTVLLGVLLTLGGRIGGKLVYRLGVGRVAGTGSGS